MHPIMADLQTDHVNILKLLKLLNQELVKFSNDDDADLYLMTDIIDYVENYPDLIHHPKEDVIFEVYMDKTNDKHETIGEMLKDHQELPAIRHDIRQALEGMIQESGMVLRKEFIDKAKAYIERQKHHLNTEEGYLFPMIRETLEEADWQDVENKMPKDEDPLFGKNLNERYKKLFECIVN